MTILPPIPKTETTCHECGNTKVCPVCLRLHKLPNRPDYKTWKRWEEFLEYEIEPGELRLIQRRNQNTF